MALRSLILTVRNPSVSANFYKSILGMIVKNETPAFIELVTKDAPSIPLIIREGTNAAMLSVGYTPIINFDVKNMENAITVAMQMGGMLDGAIKYKAFGKIAALRSPDGHMIGLFEPAEGSAGANTTNP
jgi:hypothetical protein